MFGAILQQITDLKERMNETQRQMNEYADMLHKNSTKNISETENAIIDLEIGLAELQNKAGDDND